jgi:23S rRNA pseudouridine2605 synthase
MAKERLQKILAQAGVSSRRKAEELIRAGEVRVNGKLAQIGEQAEWGKDAIKVRGKLLIKPESLVYFAFHKPRGVISMLADPQNRPHLGPYLSSIKSRVFPVGRLDFNSDGLILLTNDGEFAEKVQKKLDLPRVYSVKVKGHPTSEMLERIERGAWIGEVKKRRVQPHSVRVTSYLAQKATVQVVLMGKGAFDIKALFEMRGFLVEKVTRTAIGHITLKNLLPGNLRLLRSSQAHALIDQPELGMRLIAQEAEKKPKGKPSAPTLPQVKKPGRLNVVVKKNAERSKAR